MQLFLVRILLLVAVDNNESDGASYSEEYIGYYHIHLDDDGDEVYMAGAIHDPTSAHDIIVPVGDIVVVATEKTTVVQPGGLTTEADAPGGREYTSMAADELPEEMGEDFDSRLKNIPLLMETNTMTMWLKV